MVIQTLPSDTIVAHFPTIFGNIEFVVDPSIAIILDALETTVLVPIFLNISSRPLYSNPEGKVIVTTPALESQIIQLTLLGTVYGLVLVMVTGAPLEREVIETNDELVPELFVLVIDPLPFKIQYPDALSIV